MVKADLSRDYYADLELAPGADTATIKKQFKKLALKWHPDRNPGREAEVNAKFQQISSAHEVLSDPEQRAKYDIGRVRPSRGYGASSSYVPSAGRGNPWSTAGAGWAPPPRPPTSRYQPRSGSAGAQKFSKFTNAKPAAAPPRPPPTRPTEEGAEARSRNYQAWERMRQRQGTESQTPPKASTKAGPTGWGAPPPRPEYSADSSRSRSRDHGTGESPKRTGFMPSTPGGDEPPARNTSAYFTHRSRPSMPPPEPPPRAEPPRVAPAPSTSANGEMPDPVKHFRDSSGFEPRQSTPYVHHGGEKTDPLAGVNRSKTTREPSARYKSDDSGTFPPSGPSDRHRSSSPPRSNSFATSPPFASNFPGSSPKRTRSYANTSSSPPGQGSAPSKAKTRYNPIVVDDSSDEDVVPTQKGRFSSTPRHTQRPNRDGALPKAADVGPNGGPSRPGYASESSKDGTERKQRGSSMYATPEYSASMKFSMYTGQCPLPKVTEDAQTPTKRPISQTTGFTSTSASSEENAKWRGSLPSFKNDIPSDLPNVSTGHLTTLNAFETAQFQLLHRLVKQNKDESKTTLESSMKPKTTMPGSYPKFQGISSKSSANAYSVPEIEKQSSARAPFQSDEATRVFANWKRETSGSHGGSAKTEKAFQEFRRRMNTTRNNADGESSSFSFNPEEMADTRPGPKRFTSSSAENISTKFNTEDWHGTFTAGDMFAPDATPKKNITSGTSSRGRSPAKPRPAAPSQPSVHTNNLNGTTPATFPIPNGTDRPAESPGGTKFSAAEWAETFKPQTFAPPPFQSPDRGSKSQPFSARGSRKAARNNSTTSKGPPTRRTTGNAIIIDSSDDDSDVKPLFSGRNYIGRNNSSGEYTSSSGKSAPESAAASPNAMDIDPPATESTTGTNAQNGSALPKMQREPRNVSVDPSRAVWPKSKTPMTPSKGNAQPRAQNDPAAQTERVAKVEEDLKTNLDDLRHAEPLAQPARGLDSFNDLTSNLPFPSQASRSIPIGQDTKNELELPRPPKAPKTPSAQSDHSLPSQEAWNQYHADFKAYMAQWDIFNTRMIMHFVARKNQVDSMKPGWLEAQGNHLVDGYLKGLSEDKKVRAWWGVASEHHERAMEDFCSIRELMKMSIFKDGVGASEQFESP